MNTKQIIKEAHKAEKETLEELESKWLSHASDVGVCWEPEAEA